MKIQFIKAPSQGVLDILARRRSGKTDLATVFRAVGLVQGPLADIIMAADIAEKTAAVEVEEIMGVCPQHVALIALYGDISAVEVALNAIKNSYLHLQEKL